MDQDGPEGLPELVELAEQPLGNPRGVYMGGCQNYGPILWGVHIKGDIHIGVDIDTDSQYGWLPKLWSPFGEY